VRKKADHLDLPDKIYESIYYELEPKQRQIYNDLKTKAKAILGDDSLTITHKLTVMIRLQQTLSGFLPTDLEEGMTPLFKDPKDNPRTQALLTLLETYESEQVIVWCRFVDEIKAIEKILGDECVTYYGGTKNREANLALFLSGARRIMVANTAVGGAGLNLVNSHIAIYYSNDFSYRNRAQSEDRQHRIGQTSSVVCIDIIAEDTIDEHISSVLRAKKDVAVEMMRL
jgi:SNF2 family DNA or RNA helicase